MTDARRFDDLPPETKEFLTSLSREDVRTIRSGLPIIRAIIGFGVVTKWLAIAALGILGGIVMFGESIAKIMSWLRPPQ